VWSLAAANDRVYVSNAADGVVAIIDTDSLIGMIDLGEEDIATELAATPDGSQIYVTAIRRSDLFGRIAVIDTATDTFVAVNPGNAEPQYISVGSAADVVFSPDGRQAYIANARGGSISVLDTSTFEVLDIVRYTRAADADVDFMAISPDGTRLYVSSLTDDAMAVISTV
jgi:YVTN family beta-propeller protein